MEEKIPTTQTNINNDFTTDETRCIDLSYAISNGMAVYPGDPTTKIELLLQMPKNNSNIMGLHLTNHHGTHLDAPAHKIPNGKKLDQYPLERFFLPAEKINLMKFAKSTDIIEKNDPTTNHHFRFVQRIHADLIEYALSESFHNNPALILYTGYGACIEASKTGEDFPFLEPEAAKIIASHAYGTTSGIKLLGIDSFSVDAKGINSSHHILFQKDILLLETLVNLHKLPEQFILAAFPIKIKNSDGAMTRAVALV